MKIKPEILIPILCALLLILIYGNEIITGKMSILWLLITFIPIILLVYIVILLLKVPKQKYINMFKGFHIITKILLIITIISMILDFILTDMSGFSSIPVLLLLIALLCENLSKEEK